MKTPQDKYKDKIRKLLALAGSDNPHEAERARVQAEKMMKIHNIQAGDCDVVTVKAKPFRRRHPKASESLLIGAISAISGCEAFLSSATEIQGSSYQYKTHPMFMGLEPDAELATYSWDVLFTQLQAAQRQAKQRWGLNANDLEHFSYSWVQSAGRKLINLFGERDAPKNVKSAFERHSEGLGEGKSRPAKPTGNEDREQALASQGYLAGKEARLNQAAADQREKQARLEFTGGVSA